MIAVSALLPVHLCAQVDSAVAVRADGSVQRGELIGCDVGRQIRVRTDTEQVSLPWARLVCWGKFQDHYQGPQLLLDDGSTLVADVLRIDAGKVMVASRLWRETTIPRQAVRAIVFHFSADCHRRDLLHDRLARTTPPRDRLLLENGDELDGQCVLPFAPAAGEFNPTRVRWLPVDAETAMDVPLERVVAIWFHHDRGVVPDTAAARACVGFRDGTCLQVVDVRVADDSLQAVLACGVTLSTDTSIVSADPWRAVSFTQPHDAASVYLSDCTPIGYKHLPYLGVSWPYRTDRSVDGGCLRHGGGVYFRGMGMHSTARLAYELKRSYRWLAAALAVDEWAGTHGSVVFRVYTQADASSWTMAYESPTVHGDEPLVPMRVDLRGVKRIALIVDGADHADVWDHANWINARLVP